MTPYDSVDLTEFVEESEGQFLVFRSPDTAEDSPDYELIAECPTLEAAEEVLAGRPYQLVQRPDVGASR